MSPENIAYLIRVPDRRSVVPRVETQISRNGNGWLLGGQPAEFQRVGDGDVSPEEQLVYVERWEPNGHGDIRTSAVVVAGQETGMWHYVRAIPGTVVGGEYCCEGNLGDGEMHRVKKARLFRVALKPGA